jgi:glycosyltransferase involved in cell wall biosynthesis
LIRYNPDVLLIQGAELLNNILVFLYAGVFRKPVIWWSLGEVRGREHQGLGLVYRRLVQWLERRADAYFGCSSVAIDYFLRMGYERCRCFNLVNLVDIDLVKRNIEAARELAEPLRDKLGVRGKRVLLYVGALSQSKRIDRLIQACAKLNPTLDPVHLVIIGDGPGRAPAEVLVKTLGIGDRVTFAGALHDGVSAYFQLVDLVEEGIDPIVAAIRRCRADPGKLVSMGRHAPKILDEEHNISHYMNELLSCIAFTYNQRYNRIPKRKGQAVPPLERFRHKNCPFCGHTGSTTVRDTDGGDYAKCSRCRSEVQIGGNRDVREKSEDEQKRSRDDEQSGLMLVVLRAIDRSHGRHRLAMLRRHLPGGQPLKVGPGMGDVLDLARASGDEIEGVEHSPALARRIQQQHEVTVHGGAFEDLDFPPAQYDGWLWLPPPDVVCVVHRKPRGC